MSSARWLSINNYLVTDRSPTFSRRGCVEEIHYTWEIFLRCNLTNLFLVPGRKSFPLSEFHDDLSEGCCGGDCSIRIVAVVVDGNQISLLVSQPPDLLHCSLRSHSVRVFVIAVAGIGSRGGDPPIVAFTELEIEQGISTKVRYGSRGGDLPIVAFTTSEIGLRGSTEVRSGGRNGFVRCGERERERERIRENERGGK
ncbi:hypothetical protein TIFTF001_003928 [Ficus carica]|uniref:Uncharacterized protein n=1 Tax=Ficus carica TaxID=3494 RepID=A0AA87ZJ63_FICCA|nr:hypothetical protein TIFTF001_003928 [Ficus carica]